MSRITVAAYKPKAGKERDLLAVIAERLPLLRRLGLATERKHLVMRSASGVYIEVSEWVSDEAIQRAHGMPEVLALWQRFEGCAQFVRLDTLKEVHDNFATFEAIE
jgi:hypothetical protein